MFAFFMTNCKRSAPFGRVFKGDKRSWMGSILGLLLLDRQLNRWRGI